MEATFLADGLGTRLRSVVSDQPKPMALTEGRPFMEYVAREPVYHGITDTIFAVGYRGSMVEEHFGSGGRFGFRASYACEETLLGTAGAIKNAGRLIVQDRFYVLNTDTSYQIDYTRLSETTDVRDLDMASVLWEVEDMSRYGQAALDWEGTLTAFNEKTEEARAGTINGGAYLMKRELSDRAPEGKILLENDMIPRQPGGEKGLGGFVNDGYFIDIGIPEVYYQFQEDVRRKVIW